MTIEVTYGMGDDFAVPAERLFDYRLDFMNLPAYNPNVTNIRRTDGGTEPGPGAEYRFDLTLPGMGEMEAFLKVLDVTRPTAIVTDTGSDAMSGREVNMITASGSGARLRIDFSIELPDEAKDGVAFVEQSGLEQYRIELDLMKKILEG